jgi:hypothetical protein
VTLGDAIMLRSFARAWRHRSQQADLAKLAKRLGPHLARDIGIDMAAAPRVLPVPRPF